jgi:hypothetical protein
LLNYLLTAWSTVLLEKLTGLQLVEKFPVFYGTRRFITAFTSARYLSLSWAHLIQSIPPHPTSCRSILILSSHLRLGLPSGLFPSGFPTKTLYTPLPSPYALCINNNDNNAAVYSANGRMQGLVWPFKIPMSMPKKLFEICRQRGHLPALNWGVKLSQWHFVDKKNITLVDLGLSPVLIGTGRRP